MAGLSNARLLKQMAKYFPARWEVTRMDARVEGNAAAGTIKILCREDNKTFLSDFSAELDSQGRIRGLTLDGVSVVNFVGRLHPSPWPGPSRRRIEAGSHG
jgi:hypothetical protein